MAALRTLMLPEAAEPARTGGRPVDEGVCLRLLRAARLAFAGPASGQGCVKSLSARSSIAPGLSSATKCEAPSMYSSFRSSAWSSKPWRISGADVGSSAPARTRVGVLSRLLLQEPQDADGLGLDEVAVEGGARSCSGRFAELGDEISTSSAEKAFRSDVKPTSM